MARRTEKAAEPLRFKKIESSDMARIWPFLAKAPGRTTDYSYGGLLMWVDYFNYEYTIVRDTLFIKGLVESDRTKTAFSVPVGSMPLSESIVLLKDYCNREGIALEFSAVPEEMMPEMRAQSPLKVEELTDWADYLYPAESLVTLAGKKMSKKRNHVHQFLNQSPDWKGVPIDTSNWREALDFMDVYDLEGDDTPMAIAERKLTRSIIARMADPATRLRGMLLYAGDKVCAFTIGDIKGDTLFIHVEKATRAVNGSFEMINQVFASEMCTRHPEIKHINREDDAGDPGLRKAKESYHPEALLRKFNVIF